MMAKLSETYVFFLPKRVYLFCCQARIALASPRLLLFLAGTEKDLVVVVACLHILQRDHPNVLAVRPPRQGHQKLISFIVRVGAQHEHGILTTNLHSSLHNE
eukprot:TRINITY_DN5521_c0_g1_i2.p1 TRINITY_DN5521_c0_g1~~TRINITY_DN5521_c0_g1_i2.p1  ORF type:complete len:102 (+),score=6.26 TRINITY_DN5521_c0_g1_i2:565-870(+)